MSVRRGYGDEIWRLAREGDSASLHKAADLLLEDTTDLSYDGHRARAFALAVEGKGDDGLAQLNEGWTEEWPFPAMYATDVGRVRYLAREEDKALSALLLAVRGAQRVDSGVPELAAECVRRRPRLLWRALRVMLAGGTTLQRLRHAGTVFRARF